MAWNVGLTRCLAGLIAGLFAMAVPARAMVITETVTVSARGLDSGPLTVVVPGYEPGAGLLVSYGFTLTGTLDATVYLGAGALRPSHGFSNSVVIEPSAPAVALAAGTAVQSGPNVFGETVPFRIAGTLPLAYVESAQPAGLDLTFVFDAMLGTSEAVSESIRFTGIVSETFSYASSIPFGFSLARFAVVPQAASIPEPASAALLGSALLGIGLLIRRRSRRARR